MFRCLLHHFLENIALLSQKLYAFCNVAVKCTSYPAFLIYIADKMLTIQKDEIHIVLEIVTSL